MKIINDKTIKIKRKKRKEKKALKADDFTERNLVKVKIETQGEDEEGNVSKEISTCFMTKREFTSFKKKANK